MEMTMRKSMRLFAIAAAVLAVAQFTFHPVLAQAPGKDAAKEVVKMDELSLEKLLDMEVTSATKTKGYSVSKAPSVIRVFTRADIERYNFRTVRDILMNVP